MSERFLISELEKGVRLDKVLVSRFPSFSRTYFQYLIEENFVLLNQKPLKKKDIPKIGDEVRVTFTPTTEISLTPQHIPLTILYEDDHLIAIDKPSGLVVHPGAGNPDQTFINGLIHYLNKVPEGGDPLRPGLVHRLDKDTSGVLLAAKTSHCHALLVDMFKNKEMEKHYIALCKGVPPSGLVINHIGRHPFRRQEMCVLPEGGKHAETLITVLAHDGKIAYVEAVPKTGRTHQIRVHLKHLGAPVLYDPIYGTPSTTDRLMLHAKSLAFTHPITKIPLLLQAAIPEDLNKIIKRLEKL